MKNPEEIKIFEQDPQEAEIEIESESPAPRELVEQPDLGRNEVISDFEKLSKTNYRRLVNDCRMHVRKNNDLIICIDGYEGLGKSFFGMIFAKDLDPSFRIDTNVLFRPTMEQVKQAIYKIPQYGVLVIDETMDILYKRTSASKTNIDLNKLFAKVRKFNRIVILILPDFDDLDIFFRKRRVRVRIGIISRGLGFAMISQNFEGNPDPWYMEHNHIILEKAMGDFDVMSASPMQKLSIYQRFRGFYSPIVWKLDDLPAQTWKEYEELARSSHFSQDADEQNKAEKLSLVEKRYRLLFAVLAKKYAEEHKYDVKQFHSRLQKIFNNNCPISVQSLKILMEVQDPQAQFTLKKIDLDNVGKALNELNLKEGDDGNIV